MIRVTIEMYPFGDASKKYHLGTVDIANDGTGDDKVGHYDARLSRKGAPQSTWRAVRLTGFPRKRLGVYDLLLGVLYLAVGDRRPLPQPELK